jgi:hypothetical protein
MKREKSNMKRIKEMVKELDPSLEGAEDHVDYKTAVVLLAALLEGTGVQRLAAFTGYSEDFIAAIASRMRKAELWVEDHFYWEHWPRGGSIHPAVFWMDACVAEGLLVRRREDGDVFRYYPQPELYDRLRRRVHGGCRSKKWGDHCFCSRG